MIFIFTEKLVDVVTGEIIAYKIGCTNQYRAVVSLDKAKELNVQDYDIAEYLDMAVSEVFKIDETHYAVANNVVYQKEDWEEDMGNQFGVLREGSNYIVHGNVFYPQHICEVNNKLAIKRLIDTENGIHY